MALRAVDYAVSDAGQAFERSLRETGVAILRHPPIDPGLITAIYREWHEFFQNDAKLDYLADGDRIDGYFPPLPPGRKDGSPAITRSSSTSIPAAAIRRKCPPRR